jgi:hypothetical protein
MFFFTGGGPMTEPIRKVYRQIRLNLPADVDMLEEIQKLASKSSTDHTLLTGQAGADNTQLSSIKRQYAELRRAFNRHYFMECNLLNFRKDEIKEAERAFTMAKNALDFDNDKNLNKIMTQMERRLNHRRYPLKNDQFNKGNTSVRTLIS